MQTIIGLILIISLIFLPIIFLLTVFVYNVGVLLHQATDKLKTHINKNSF